MREDIFIYFFHTDLSVFDIFNFCAWFISLIKLKITTTCDVYFEFLTVVTRLTFISCTTTLLEKCQTGITEGTVWAKELAMALGITHLSKEPDGKGKVSVKILFLDWGV